MMPAIGGELITGMANPRRSLLRRLGARSVERPESASYSDVVVIRALQQLHAREAIPALELLLNDYGHSHVDDLISVTEAAQRAIVRIQSCCSSIGNLRCRLFPKASSNSRYVGRVSTTHVKLTIPEGSI